MRRTAPFLLLLCLLSALVLPQAVQGTKREPQGGDTVLHYCSDDTPLSIPDEDPEGVTSTIQVPGAYTILDLNLVLSVTHGNVGDLRVALANSDTLRTIIRRPGGGACSGNNLNDNVADDEASLSFEYDCSNGSTAYIPGAAYRAGDPPSTTLLSAYDQRTTAGDWLLNVQDDDRGASGELRRWCVQFTVPAGTPTATPTEAPLPTATHTPTSTATPQVPPTPTATATSLPPGTRLLFAPAVVRGYAALDCQSVENEYLFPNDDVPMAESSPPLCTHLPFSGRHDVEEDREDIYRLIVPGTAPLAVVIALDVPGIDLSLRLYDASLDEIVFSAGPGPVDESVSATLPPGTYFVRVYRPDANTSQEPYLLTVTGLSAAPHAHAR